MIKYPLSFKAFASSIPGIDSSWESRAGNFPDVTCSIPRDFMGPDTGYSPEDLMAMAVINCFIATFKVFSEKAKLTYSKIEAAGVIEIDRLSTGFVGVSKLTVDVVIMGVSDHDRALVILNETKKNCLMANAIKADITFNFKVV